MSALAPERERVPPFVKSVSTSTKPDQLVAPPRTSRRTLADLVKGGRSRLSFPFRGGLDPALKGAGASFHGDQVMMA